MILNKCPCCSGNTYEQCCGLYITDSAAAPTPLDLMRSRYTAYTMANIDYIQRTMKGAALARFNHLSATEFATQSQWCSLQIINTKMLNSNRGIVEFIAHYIDNNGLPQQLHEVSEFILENTCWYYIGELASEHQTNLKQASKVGRNDSCPCGSHKKFKKCCGG